MSGPEFLMIKLVNNQCGASKMDGPTHSARIITELLNRKFGDRWIGRSGNNRWAARFPDLTFMDFYLWGKLKQ